MVAHRPTTRVAAAMAVVSLACGSDDGAAGDTSDASSDPSSDPISDLASDPISDLASDTSSDPSEDTAPVPSDHTYILGRIDLPSTPSEAAALGMDIDGEGDGADNQLGSAMATIGASSPDLDLQIPIDLGIDRGRNLHLVLLRSASLGDAADAELHLYRGATATPEPCTGPGDTVCRGHLQGDGVFTVDDDAASATFAGSISDGDLGATSDRATIEIYVTSTATMDLDLQRARIELDALGADGWQGRLGGALAMSDVAEDLVPAIALLLREAVADECTLVAPECGCPAGSSGAAYMSFFDTDPEDCAIADDEVSGAVLAFLTPDIDLDGDGAPDAVSLGVGLSGVKATFAAP